MAVRMIDVPAAGRDWDRGGTIDAVSVPTVETVFGIPSTLCLEITENRPKGNQAMDLALLVERRKDRDGVISQVYPLRVSSIPMIKQIKI